MSIKGRHVLIKEELDFLQQHCGFGGQGWCSSKAFSAPRWWHQTSASAAKSSPVGRDGCLFVIYLWCLRASCGLSGRSLVQLVCCTLILCEHRGLLCPAASDSANSLFTLFILFFHLLLL